MATVRDVMTTEVTTVHPEMGITEVADLLAERGYGAVPVVGAGDVYEGLLRDEDLVLRESGIHVPTTIAILPGIEFTLPGQLKRYDEDLKRAAAATVGDLMSTDAPTVRAEATIEELATVMHDKQVSHVPVLDAAGKVIGIVARGDLVRHLAQTT